jgi:hypothetical protein
LNDTWATLLKEGGAIAALTVVFFILRLLMPLFQKHAANTSNGNGNKLWGLTPTEWERRMEKLHQESEERLMVDMRTLLNARTLAIVEGITEPLVKEIRGLRDDLAKWERSRSS